MNKIEDNILIFILIEAMITLFFFKLSFINIIIGILFGILMIIINKKIKKNYLTKLTIIFGSFLLAIISLIKIVDFIHYNLLPSHSWIIILLSFIMISYYLVKKDFHTFIKTTEIVSYTYFFLKIIALILIIPKIHLSYINNSIQYSNISYSFLYLGFYIFFIYNAIYYLTNRQISIKLLTITFINPLIIKLISILVLGNELFNKYSYPTVNYLKNINYFDFIERCDGILLFKYLISYYILFIFLIFNIKTLKKTKI